MTTTANSEDAQKLIHRAGVFMQLGIGSLRERKEVINKLRAVEHEVDDPEEVGVVTDLLIRDTDVRFSLVDRMNDLTRARPTERGHRNRREHFERLLTEITRCRTGDGTLSLNEKRDYTNPVTQALWLRYTN